MIIKPKRLNIGDTIGVIAPSGGNGAIFPHRVENGVKALENLGFKVKLFPTTKNICGLGKSGSEEERLKDLHDAFKDKEVKAIICNIGGICTNSILNKIDFELIKNNPKIFCGYSDITNLHHAIQKKTGLITFYGPCLMTQFGEYPKPLEYTINSFMDNLVKGKNEEIKPSEKWTDEILDWFKKDDLIRPRELIKNNGYKWIKNGRITAQITGGCLYSLLQLKGTKFEPEYKDKILFIETAEGQIFRKGDPLEYVDAQINDLKNSGVFEKILGLIVGRPFGYTEEERKIFEKIIKDQTKNYNFPVLFNVDIGHTDPLITLPMNVKVLLDSSKNIFKINESGVK
ncbi:MAG: S66 peptidase family protein [Nanoarchaeota archaeon]